MPCGKTCQKLWTSYLNKYGDFRERARAIRDDQECFKQFQLPRLQRRPSTQKSSKRYDSTLPLEYCSSSLSKTDRENLEKLIQAEDFPENIFSKQKESQSRSSIDEEMTISISKKFELETSFSQHPTANHVPNPYAQWLKRIDQVEKANKKQSDREFRRRSSVSTINESTDQCLGQFLSFLHSLDHTTDQSVNKQTLITLFSLDNHLSSSIDVPIAIEQMKIIPKSLIQHLDNTPILKQIQTKPSRKDPRLVDHRQFLNEISPRVYDFNQDTELHSRLSTTYIIKAFKDYLITHHRSIRLPKLFDDLDRY